MTIFDKLGNFITEKFGWIWNLSFLIVFLLGVFLIPGFFAKVVFVAAFAGKIFEMYAWHKKISG
jgi:hypothetical protein